MTPWIQTSDEKAILSLGTKAPKVGEYYYGHGIGSIKIEIREADKNGCPPGVKPFEAFIYWWVDGMDSKLKKAIYDGVQSIAKKVAGKTGTHPVPAGFDREGIVIYPWKD